MKEQMTQANKERRKELYKEFLTWEGDIATRLCKELYEIRKKEFITDFRLDILLSGTTEEKIKLREELKKETNL